MNSTGLLIIGGGAFLLLASKRGAVANTANLTAQQRQALANAQQQNSLFAGLGTLLKNALGGGAKQPAAGSGGGSKAGGGGAPSSAGGGGGGSRGGGPVTCPDSHCPAEGCPGMPDPQYLEGLAGDQLPPCPVCPCTGPCQVGVPCGPCSFCSPTSCSCFSAQCFPCTGGFGCFCC